MTIYNLVPPNCHKRYNEGCGCGERKKFFIGFDTTNIPEKNQLGYIWKLCCLIKEIQMLGVIDISVLWC